MLKIVNYLCLIEAGLGILLALVLPHESGYVFGGGLILGSIFTFFIGMGLGMMALYNDRQHHEEPTPPINQGIDPLQKGI
jgi:hypothetical protein